MAARVYLPWNEDTGRTSGSGSLDESRPDRIVTTVPSALLMNLRNIDLSKSAISERVGDERVAFGES